MAVSNLTSTPSGFNVIKFGSATINSGSTFVDVSLSGLPATYSVVVLPSSTISVAVNLYTSNKTTSGFRINAISAPTSNVTVDYIVVG
jgi:hypothetical protein